MRPPSSSSDGDDRPTTAVAGRGLFDDVLSRGGAWEATRDEAWLQAMLDAEAALAWALVDVGLAAADDAKAVESCCRVEQFDISALGRDAAAGGNPVIPLVTALRSLGGDPAANLVHRGATSQDILDTAAMLVARRAVDAVLDDVAVAADRAAGLARAHRSTPIAGRTLLQQAVPTTFGLKAAVWLAGLDAAAHRLSDVREHRLAAQLGGAAGTLAEYGAAGLQMMERFAERVGLDAPSAPWHTERTRVADLAGALAEVAGAVGKVAQDIVLLAQNEVAEVAEVAEVGDQKVGGSSAMAHKHNPVAAVSARAAALQAPPLAASLLASMAQEHERAAGAWHAEWRPLTALLRTTGSAASWLAESLARLDVDVDRMRRNLAELTTVLGLQDLDEAIGSAPALVDRTLADHELQR